MIRRIVSDFRAALDNDPAARGFWGALEIIFTYSGFHAMIAYRIAHILHQLKIPFIPRVMSQVARFLTGIEIHPGARIGSSFFIDHGMGVVIGATARIGDDVLIYSGVVIGSTSRRHVVRHPTIGSNVLIGANAVLLGPIHVGKSAKIGAGAVVREDVPPHAVVLATASTHSRREVREPLICLETVPAR